jgi:hypothetical protein
MALTFGLKNPRDLLEKLKRDAALLDEEVTSDRFFNFVVTGYSVIDWVKNGPSNPSAQGDIRNMYDDQSVKVCGDLCTAAKHFVLTARKPITQQADSIKGAYGMARYGKGAYGEGEEFIQIELADGSSFSCLEFVENVIKAWEEFFAFHGL